MSSKQTDAARRSSRRRFLKQSAAAVAAATFIPPSAFGANDRVNVGCIGIGGKGAGEVADVARAGGTIVALCDVDDGRRKKKGKDATETYPEARFYRDFRVMLEKEADRIDAVTVSTPDHVHCHASVTAMRMGKHVYCQKPLTHSVWEARLMTETAREKKVATQMGNQAHADEPIRRGVELIRAGLIGRVSEVHAWTNRPIWPQGMTERPPEMPVPETLDWDLWLGPAPFRPYNEAYVPFKWRGWWDFGTGALGDMGCHIMDMPYWALGLKYPQSVVAESEGNTAESGPTSATVTYRFPAGEYSGDLTYVWYDGGRMPAEEVLAGSGIPDDQLAKRFDLVMVGEKGKFFFRRSRTDWVTSPASLLADFDPPPQTIPRVENEDAEWIAACRGGPAALSNFAQAGPFSEMILLGNLAIRTGEKLQWDGPKMKATNCPAADQYIRREYRKGWEL
jgi:predicted dehydrogenase